MSIYEQIVSARRRARAAASERARRMRTDDDAELDQHSAAQKEAQAAPRDAEGAAAQHSAQVPVSIGVRNFYGRDPTRSSVVELRLQRFLGHVRQRLDTLGHTFVVFPLQEQAFSFADAHELSDLIRYRPFANLMPAGAALCHRKVKFHMGLSWGGSGPGVTGRLQPAMNVSNESRTRVPSFDNM